MTTRFAVAGPARRHSRLPAHGDNVDKVIVATRRMRALEKANASREEDE